eukprot:COSAG01_NODE_173_length_23099_cov_37.564783_15_plen_108_part_00
MFGLADLGCYAIVKGRGAGLRQGDGCQHVSRPFPSWNRSILTEIYLCHACSCQEMLRTETAGQVITGVGPQPAQRGAQTFLFGAGGNQGGEGNDEAGEWCAIAACVS